MGVLRSDESSLEAYDAMDNWRFALVKTKFFLYIFFFYIFVSPCAIIIKLVSQSSNNTQFSGQKVILNS
jgi:hypothetical protein